MQHAGGYAMQIKGVLGILIPSLGGSISPAPTSKNCSKKLLQAELATVSRQRYAKQLQELRRDSALPLSRAHRRIG